MRGTKKENDSGPKFGEEKVFIKSDDEEMETEGDKKGRGETQEAKKLNCRKTGEKEQIKVDKTE